jgi:hypothetical protein
MYLCTSEAELWVYRLRDLPARTSAGVSIRTFVLVQTRKLRDSILPGQCGGPLSSAALSRTGTPLPTHPQVSVFVPLYE